MAQKPIQVFVHLARGFGAEYWNRRWKEGKILGINEPFPYGYHRAQAMGCAVTYSQDVPENAAAKLFRLGIRAILGFDLIHAWRNFAGIRGADVVWTHTESQYLAILLLLRLSRAPRGPRLIAQSVWLFDRWPKFPKMRQRLISGLVRHADILTVHSPENLDMARRLFPGVRSELVLFGIATETKVLPSERSSGKALNIVSLGNDEHRDWNLLLGAVSGRRDWKLRIASQTINASSVGNAENVEIVGPKTNGDLLALYGWADLLVLALKPNLHASGITVIQEAVLQGVPVICSDTGGLKAYFDETQVRFVSPRDVTKLRDAIDELAGDPEARLSLARNAQASMGPNGLSSESFVRRHVEISKDLLEPHNSSERSAADG